MQVLSSAALILAAGNSRRFGSNKLLADLDGRPILQHVVDLALDAKLAPVVVVLGKSADAVEPAIEWRSATRVRNDNPGRGLSSSVRLGLEALGVATRVLVLLGDQPRLSVEQLRTVLAAPVNLDRPLVVPVYEGVAGNPVLLETTGWQLARSLAGDRGMSQLFATRPETVRYVAVAGSNPDVDTPEDLATIRA